MIAGPHFFPQSEAGPAASLIRWRQHCGRRGGGRANRRVPGGRPTRSAPARTLVCKLRSLRGGSIMSRHEAPTLLGLAMLGAGLIYVVLTDTPTRPGPSTLEEVAEVADARGLYHRSDCYDG